MRLKLLLAAWLAVLAPAECAGLRVGRAAVRITPPPGVPMAGYYSVRLAEGTHDELYAKAIVLEAGGRKAALVACDLVAVDAELAAEARKIAESATSIPAAHIMISATHSHTGPLLRKRFWEYMPAAAVKLAKAYRSSLPARIAEAVKQADAGLADARASAVVGREESVSFHRRFLMKDGTVRTNPGKLNPNIVQPMGGIDPDVGVVHFESSGKALATYVNFALHLDTVGGPLYSADYPHTLARILGKLHGPDMLTLFTIGAAGNINHVDVKTRDSQKGHGEAARIGTVLAGETIKTMARLKPVEAAGLRIAREMVTLPLPEFRPADLARAKETAGRFGKGGTTLELVEAFRVMEVSGRAELQAEIQVVALGDQLAWVGLPGEVFAELGMAVKKASPFPFTIVAELANGTIQYVPTRKAFTEGAYEVANSLVAPGGGEMLADAAIGLLARLHRQ